MADYVYLDTNTPFEANELNLRFDSLMGAAKGFNALSVEDLSLGSLRHNHLPVMIHDSTLSESDLLPAAPVVGTGPFSAHRSLSFSTATKITAPSGVVITPVTFPNATAVEAVDAETPSPQNVTGIIVLSNVEIVKFGEQNDFKVREDYAFVTASLRVTDSAGTSAQILSSRRALSARLTIGHPQGMPMFGSGSNRDHLTNQDLSIRSVLTAEIIAARGLIDVKKIELNLTANFTDVYYGKANLTAIPLQAKLT